MAAAGIYSAQELQGAAQLVDNTRCDYVIYGQWRDGIFDLLSPGSWPTFWMATCSPCCWPCLFGKIASRIRWNPGMRFLGNTPFKQWTRMLSILMFCMVICYFMQTAIQGKIAGIIYQDMVNNHKSSSGPYDPYNPPNLSKQAMDEIEEQEEYMEVFETGAWLVGAIFSVLICLLRFRLRKKFHIPATCDSGPVHTENGQQQTSLASVGGLIEDFACGWCCGCCSLAQMGRHTHAVSPTCSSLSPCMDPGPAETMTPAHIINPAQRQHLAQMQVFSVQPASMYDPNTMYTVPAAGAYVPPVAFPVPTGVAQAMPAGHTETGQIETGRPVQVNMADK